MASPADQRPPEPQRAAHPRRVALVNLPFADHRYPSVALSTFSVALRERGHRVEVFYLNLDAAVRLGLPTYYAIQVGTGWHGLIGEWLFASPTVAPGAADAQTYRRFLGRWGDGVEVDMGYFDHDPGVGPYLFDELDLPAVRAELDGLLDEWLARIDWAVFDVVGFTVAFQQLNAALRLAERLKAAHPRLRIAFGGAALRSPMGEAIAARYPWLDAVFVGLADFSFPDWVDRLPEAGSDVIEEPVPPRPLDELPIPAYDDYLSQLRASGLYQRGVVRVAAETSRGCWWGEKNQCTFCGFNAEELRSRHKSSARVVGELRELSRYGEPIYVVDNILPRHYFDEVFPQLRAGGFRLPGAFFFLKSNMTRAELEQLVATGVTWVQPGIESLSTAVLETMRKGVTAVRNVWILRVCEELALHPVWGLLYGFPQEPHAAYAAMGALIPDIVHLPAPTGCFRVLLCRYSPLHNEADRLGLAEVRPAQAYALAHGSHPGLEDQAYTFDYRLADGAEPETYARPLIDAVGRWVDLRALPLAARCEVVTIAGRRILIDSRARGRAGRALPRLQRIDDADWEILTALDSPTTLRGLRERYRRADLEGRLRRLVADRQVLHLDGRYLRLVVVRANSSPLHELRRVATDKLEQLRHTTVSSLTRQAALRHELRQMADRLGRYFRRG